MFDRTPLTNLPTVDHMSESNRHEQVSLLVLRTFDTPDLAFTYMAFSKEFLTELTDNAMETLLASDDGSCLSDDEREEYLRIIKDIREHAATTISYEQMKKNRVEFAKRYAELETLTDK